MSWGFWSMSRFSRYRNGEEEAQEAVRVAQHCQLRVGLYRSANIAILAIH